MAFALVVSSTEVQSVRMPSMTTCTRLVWLIVVSASLSIPAFAAGHLMIYPSRVVFEGRTRTAQLDLINNGEACTYRISMIRQRMTDTGQFVTVTAPLPGEAFADEMIRFSPRQVTLPAGGAQAVRLQLRKPAGLPTGEYRVHLFFQALPPARSIAAGDSQPVGPEGMDIALIPIVSISIPIIVREGSTSATLSLTSLRVNGQTKTDAAALSFELHRDGNRSVYGDVVAYFTPRGGSELVVGRANGVAVYVPNQLRIAELPIQTSAGQKLASGRLRVSFLDKPDAGGKLLAEATLDLP
jgi:hypothetical protein